MGVRAVSTTVGEAEVHRRRGSTVYRMAIMVTALVAGVFSTTGCTTYRLCEPTTTAPEGLVGKVRVLLGRASRSKSSVQ